MDRKIRSGKSNQPSSRDSVLNSDPHRPIAASARLRLGKSQRVCRGSEFGDAIRGGSVAADGVLVVFVVPARCEVSPRLGVTIPKKTGNAVVRNRWKRWIREAFRIRQHEIPTGYDIIVRPKKDAVGDWQSIERSIRKLVPKAISRIKP